MRRYWSIGIVFLAVQLFGAACSPAGAPSGSRGSAPGAPGQPQGPAAVPQRAPEPVKINIAYTSLTAQQSSLWLAQEAGYLAQEALEAELTYIPSASQVTQAMLGGDVPIAITGGEGVAAASLEGADMVMLASHISTVIMRLMTPKDISSPADLKDKKVGVTRFGSSSDAWMRFIIRRFGLQPDQDVAVLQMGGAPEALAGMQAGAVQGYLAAPPNNLLAIDAGFKELIDLASLGVPYAANGVATTKSFVRDKEDVVRRFMRAYVKGIHRFITDKQYTITVLAQYTRTTDPRTLDEAYDSTLKYTVRVPYPSAEGIQTILDMAAARNPSAKDVDPRTLVDDRFVRELEASGFIAALYGPSR